MKILIYGAGVLGSLYAARLKEARHDVAILARGKRLAQIREHGIVLENDENGERTITTAVQVVERLNPEDTYDWVLVILRKNQVRDVLPALAANKHTPNVVFMVNNAAGATEMVQALGRERVLLGFPGAGGGRFDHVVRYRIASDKAQPTTIGELDGSITPRLTKIVDALSAAGFPAATSPNMDAWLKTHVALVSPIANAIYAAGGDNYRLVRTRDAIVLMIRAVHEGYQVLRANHIPITPAKLKILEWIPEPFLVALLQRRLATEAAELNLARHANAARDEMQQLADEFRVLAHKVGVATPSIDRLYGYLAPTMPPMPEGKHEMPINWRGILIALGSFIPFVGLIVVGRLFRPRHQH